jgi:hypothetical protein
MRYIVEATKELRANDLHIEFDNLNDGLIWLAQNVFASDGYRIIKYQERSGVLRAGSKAVVRAYKENEMTSTEYETIELAEAAIAALSDSDGYDLIDLEQPLGSAPSIIIGHRPALWTKYHESYEGQRGNDWSRTDGDRY